MLLVDEVTDFDPGLWREEKILVENSSTLIADEIEAETMDTKIVE